MIQILFKIGLILLAPSIFAEEHTPFSKVSAYRECLFPLKSKLTNSPHLLKNSNALLLENSFFDVEVTDPKLSSSEKAALKERQEISQQFQDAVIIPGTKLLESGYYVLTQKSALFIPRKLMDSSAHIKTATDGYNLGEYGGIKIIQEGKNPVVLSWLETYKYKKGKKPDSFKNLPKEFTTFQFSLPADTLIPEVDPPYVFRELKTEESDSSETLNSAQNYLSNLTENIKCPGFEKAEWDWLQSSVQLSVNVRTETILARTKGKPSLKDKEEIADLRNDFFAQERQTLIDDPKPAEHLANCQRILASAQINLPETFLSILNEKKQCLTHEHKRFMDRVSGTAGFAPDGSVLKKAGSKSTLLK